MYISCILYNNLTVYQSHFKLEHQFIYNYYLLIAIITFIYGCIQTEAYYGYLAYIYPTI